MRADRVAIGHGVSVSYVDSDEEREGLYWYHPGRTGPCSGGYVSFRGSKPDLGHGWVVESAEPLTLAPSLRCRACGCHGYIRDGKWVPC